jgi:hypothetical protein
MGVKSRAFWLWTWTFLSWLLSFSLKQLLLFRTTFFVFPLSLFEGYPGSKACSSQAEKISGTQEQKKS